MKKFITGIVAAAAIAGLVLALSYHPNRTAAVGTSSPATQPGSTTSTASPKSYKDGTYTGSATDNEYGTVQVAAVISGGKLTNVKFLQLPNDREHSVEISNLAKPVLLQEALQAQSANVDIVSGATSTSGSFQQSLGDALNQAS